MKELGEASVPFACDKHALSRRAFFYSTHAEVRDVLARSGGHPPDLRRLRSTRREITRMFPVQSQLVRT